MATEEWTVHAKLTGEFYISDERRSSEAPLVEGLRQLKLSPSSMTMANGLGSMNSKPCCRLRKRGAPCWSLTWSMSARNA